MKFITCLATVCMFALASSAVIPANTDSGLLGTIKVPQAFLIKNIQAELKIYVINPTQKIQLPLDAAQLKNANYVDVNALSTDITSNPQFPSTGVAPSNQFFSLESNVVIEIWDYAINNFVGGSVLTFQQAEKPSQSLTLQDSTGTFAGVAQLVYVPPTNA